MNNNTNVAFDLVWKPKVEYNFCWTELDPAKLKLGLLLFKEDFRGGEVVLVHQVYSNVFFAK